MLRQLLRPVTRRIGQRGTRSYQDHHADYKPPSLDEVPVPQGSWQANYDAKQKSYNLQLAAGIAFFAGTLAYMINTGVIFFNWAPPVPKEERK